jgi:hypothetical protein
MSQMMSIRKHSFPLSHFPTFSPAHASSPRFAALRPVLSILVAIALLIGPASLLAEPASPAGASNVVKLVDLLPIDAHQGWGTLGVNKSVMGKPLAIGNRSFEHGFGTHAPGELLFDLAGEYERFESWVGVDAAMIPHKLGSTEFVVYGDGRELFRSGVMHETDPAKRVSVDVAGVQQLKLAVTDGGDGINGDNADWAEAVVIAKTAAAQAEKPARFKVTSPSIAIGLTEDGEIAGFTAGAVEQAIRGQTHLSGCRTQGTTAAKELPDGGMTFTRKLLSLDGHACTLTERFYPTPDSIRWEIEITGQGEPWSAPIITTLACSNPQETRFWAAWADPESRPGPWHDPLALSPLTSRGWYYGNAAQTSPVGGDFVSLPLVTLAPDNRDAALSLVLSPEDVLLDMRLLVSATGQIRFSRTRYRLGGGKTVHFAMDLVAHEADWRGGLRWMATRYPAFFDPPNPEVDAMAGCGAYSGDENPIDVAKFKKMAFRINWKLSDDFPYMGLFIPPVKDAGQRWTRSCDEKAPPGKGETISARQMNDYAKYMKDNGFYVLNYFNVTEFGKNMEDREIPAARANDPDLWKDPVAFIKLRLPNAYLKPPMLTCYNAWLVDVGDPGYHDFMLEQAKRHIDLVPDSFGICIDRMDWLRLYNPDGDDGVSWVDAKPARSLYRSWMAFTADLGPLMHKAGKVIFGNTMTMRLELSRQLDGIYTEHGNYGGALNGAALMGIRKPVLAWTINKDLREPDPNSFFQRHLHMGAYPTAPYPTNNHCTMPDAWTERQFIDYGPLMDVMRGKKWVLAPHCVEAVTPGVKVNLFEIPGGYALPVTFGGRTESATVKLRGVPGLDKAKCEALHPGQEAAVAVPATFKNGELELHVPLKRGCAMVRVSTR